MKKNNIIRVSIFLIMGSLLIFSSSCKKDDPIPLMIGQTHQGGIIAYLLLPGDPGYNAQVQHGLIVAPTDQGIEIEWGCLNGSITGTGKELGTGQANTTAIVSGCSVVNIAARLCDDLILEGYSDWYLPSIDELNLIYVNLSSKSIGGFADYRYWSSSQEATQTAWREDMTLGLKAANTKSNLYYVRAVRSF